jgi:hypothetical protein
MSGTVPPSTNPPKVSTCPTSLSPPSPALGRDDTFQARQSLVASDLLAKLGLLAKLTLEQLVAVLHLDDPRVHPSDLGVLLSNLGGLFSNLVILPSDLVVLLRKQGILLSNPGIPLVNLLGPGPFSPSLSDVRCCSDVA